MLLSAFGRLQHPAPRLFDALLGGIEPQITLLDDKGTRLASMLWACAQVRHMPPLAVLNVVSRWVQRRLDVIGTGRLSVICQSLGRLGYSGNSSSGSSSSAAAAAAATANFWEAVASSICQASCALG